jgi:transcriptional regulator with XRE-family HTH domain
MTNQEVADMLGITHSAVSRLRAGNRLPNLDTMARIETALDWPATDQFKVKYNHGPAAYSQELENRISAFRTNG